MLIANNLNTFFQNHSIIFVDSKIKATKQITTDKAIFFVDENNQIQSINWLDNSVLKISKDQKYFSLNLEQEEIVKQYAKENNLSLNIISQFVYGRILSRNVHPKSEKLFVLEVLIDTKENKTVTLVTNTLDSQEGKVVVLARPGATTFMGTSVLTGKVLDVTSEGMLTGYKTLGKEKEGLIFGTEEQIGKEYLI
ncbi:TyrS-associated PheT N-terminal domain-related protein TapR [Mycoplasma buteonis]|uniref:TyrS-associated PheT N-terminal domain-related protein TapR n=1 Tax=Mycoplasma buteonis TaxID=171280 RepID=UPI000559C5C9|nr:hypothetical protein [Mycoplasma buteonis]